MKTFDSLTEQEILALAISLEEEDARIFDDFADGLQADYPTSAEKFKTMRAEEDGHRHRLLDLRGERGGCRQPIKLGAQPHILSDHDDGDGGAFSAAAPKSPRLVTITC